MTGCNYGLLANLKQVKPSLIGTICINHSIQLACTDAAKSLPGNVSTERQRFLVGFLMIFLNYNVSFNTDQELLTALIFSIFDFITFSVLLIFARLWRTIFRFFI